MNIEQPTPKQIRNSIASGWQYLGDGIFAKGDWLGYFTKQGFYKEFSEA